MANNLPDDWEDEVGVDDWEEAPTPAPAPQVDALAAGVRGFNQGATLGWADELIGAVESIDKGFSDTTAQLAQRWGSILRGGAGGLPGEKHEPLSYEQARDAQRALDRQAREERPGAYIPAEIVGQVATSRALGPLGRGYGGAAATGAVTGAGASESDTAAGVAGGAALGAGFGVLGERAGRYLGRALPAASRSVRDWLEEKAAEKALKAAGYIQKDLKPMIRRDPGSVQRAGQALIEEPGIITPGATVKDVAERLENRLASYGDQIGRARQEADALGARFDIEPFLQRVETEILEPIIGDPAVRREAAELARLIRGYRALAQQRGGLGFEEANNLKTRLQKTINFGNHFATGGPAEQAERFVKQMQHDFASELDRQLGMVLDEGSIGAYRDAMARYGVVKDALDKARQGIAREGGNSTFRLSDYLTGVVGSTLGGPAGALVGPVVSKVARERGDSALATLARRASQSDITTWLSTRSPESLGRWAGPLMSAAARGPGALAAIDKVLRDTDEQYRRMREQQQEAAQP